MKDEGLAGRWSGWWRQGAREGHERFTVSTEAGRLSAQGQDEDGIFSLAGQIYADGTASLTKVYLHPFVHTPASMAYLGHWDGRAIQGTWINEQYPSDHGPFRMWPSVDPLEQQAAAGEILASEGNPADAELVPVRPRHPAGRRWNAPSDRSRDRV